MPALIDLSTTGIKELAETLNRLGSFKTVKTVMKKAGAHIKGKINKYPKATAANSPDSGRWYERGYGPRWKRKDGSIGGRKTSETLGKRWAVSETNAGWGVEIGNNASYAPYVHDPEDQAKFHGERGWKTTEQVADDERDTVVRFIEEALQREIDSIGG